MFTRSLVVGALVVSATFTTGGFVQAAPGDPVTSFGNDGVDHWHDYGDEAQIASLKDGSFLVGHARFDYSTETSTAVFVSRFTGDGGLMWSTSFPKPHKSIHLVDLLAHDERIDVVMSDFVKTGTERHLVARLLQDGTADPTWNGGKPVSLGASTGYVEASATLSTADGGLLLVAGNRLVKLSSTGKLDKSFSGDGIVTLTLPTNDSYVTDLARRENGELALALVNGPDSYHYTSYVAVVGANGKPKKAFGNNGFRKVPLKGHESVIITDLDVMPNGNMALGLAALVDYEFTSRFHGGVAVVSGASGKFVTSFSDDGYQVLRDATEHGCCIAVQSDGRILVGGSRSRFWRVLRFMPDGTKDTTFGKNGMLSVRVGETGRAFVTDLAIDRKNDRLLIGGTERDDLGGEYVAFGSFSLV